MLEKSSQKNTDMMVDWVALLIPLRYRKLKMTETTVRMGRERKRNLLWSIG